MQGRELLVSLAAFLVLGPGAAWAQSGLEIMEKERQLHHAKDEEEAIAMKLVDKDGSVKERRIVIFTLTDAQKLNKILIRFQAPRDVEDTGLLTWERKDGNDDQWLYLPATKRAKRIASSGKKNRFMGTDFAYEDLRRESLSLHTYNLVGSETLDGQPCFLVEALPGTPRQAADSGYSKRKIWVRKDNHAVAKREYYDKKGKLEKVETKRKLANVKGTIWRATETDMHDVQAQTRTVLVVDRRALDKGLNERLFTEAELTRGGS